MIMVIWRVNDVQKLQNQEDDTIRSSLLRLIQNNSMPILDLLVGICTNSLDAAKSVSVSVDFITGTFISKNSART